MVFQESKEWISNSHDYEIVEKHLWRSWSGPASWCGKENSGELIVILNDQWTPETYWLKTLRSCHCTNFVSRTLEYFQRGCCKSTNMAWCASVRVSEVLAVVGCSGKLVLRKFIVWKTHNDDKAKDILFTSHYIYSNLVQNIYTFLFGFFFLSR